MDNKSEVTQIGYTWLGIPAAEQPPHHYRLLGLPLFTDDRAAISRALRARIAQVRLADAGRQPELAERLVAELTFARQTLLDPPKKLTYDAILRVRGSPRLPLSRH